MRNLTPSFPRKRESRFSVVEFGESLVSRVRAQLCGKKLLNVVCIQTLYSSLHNRHSRESGNPDSPQADLLKVWIPAFAGMTVVGVTGRGVTRRTKGWKILGSIILATVLLASPAHAGKLKPAQIIKLYKQECNANMRSLQAQLADGHILIRGKKTLAATSSQLACNTDAKNPTIRQMNNKKWLAGTEKFIVASGVDAYAIGARKGMAATLVKFNVAGILATASAKGLSEEELAVLGNMTRAVAFTEAHVKAAQVLFKKK